MSTSNHIVKSDPSEGSICVDAGVGGNQGYYPSIASSLLGCYVKDGKPLTITGRQPWKCVRMKMKYKGGSIVGGSIVGGSIVRGSIVVLNPRFRDN